MKTPEECQKAKDELTAHQGLKKYYFLCKMEKKKRLMVCPQQTREDGFSI